MHRELANHPFRASHGTVAARVQALQNIRVSPEHIHIKHPRVFSRTFEPDVVVSHGRRKEGSFASPAGRTSRDGTEGFKGDGRPPVGSADLKLQSSPVLRSLERLPNLRPATSLALDDPFISSKDGPTTPRRAMSQEQTEQPRSELAGARARLRHINSDDARNQQPTPQAGSTLAELGFMIDSALDDNRPNDTPTRDFSDSPPRSMTRNKGKAIASKVELPRTRAMPFTRYRSQDPAVMAQPLSSPARPSNPLHYPELVTSPRSLSPVPRSRQRTLSDESMTIAGSMPKRCSSPVKETAAIYESLSLDPNIQERPTSPPPRAHLHIKDEWTKVPYHEPTPEEEARYHRTKFGVSINEKYSHNGLAGQRSSGDSDGTYNTAQQSKGPDTSGLVSPTKGESFRAPSSGWPAKTAVSVKSGLASPQPVEETISPDRRGAHHRPTTRPSIVSQKIAQLALAGFEDHAVSRSRPASTTSQLAESSGQVKVSRLHDHNIDGGLLSTRHLPQYQLPIQEQADALAINKVSPSRPS